MQAAKSQIIHYGWRKIRIAQDRIFETERSGPGKGKRKHRKGTDDRRHSRDTGPRTRTGNQRTPRISGPPSTIVLRALRVYRAGSSPEGLLSPCPARPPPSGPSGLSGSTDRPPDQLTVRTGGWLAKPGERSSISADRPGPGGPDSALRPGGRGIAAAGPRGGELAPPAWHPLAARVEPPRTRAGSAGSQRRCRSSAPAPPPPAAHHPQPRAAGPGRGARLTIGTGSMAKTRGAGKERPSDGQQSDGRRRRWGRAARTGR